MGHFLGAPVLDEDFVSAYLRFTDDTAEELFRQLRAANVMPQTETSFAVQWEPILTQLNPNHTLRVLFDWFSTNVKPYFYAEIEGVATGPFDVILDAQRDEQFVLGQLHKAGSKSFYDVWTSHKMPDSPVLRAGFRGLHYSVETSILPNNSLEATTSVRLRAESGAERVLVFQLSRALSVDRVANEERIAGVFSK
jgi:hypothetical protein